MKVYRFDVTDFGIMKSARTHIAAPGKHAKRSGKTVVNGVDNARAQVHVVN